MKGSICTKDVVIGCIAFFFVIYTVSAMDCFQCMHREGDDKFEKDDTFKDVRTKIGISKNEKCKDLKNDDADDKKTDSAVGKMMCKPAGMDKPPPGKSFRCAKMKLTRKVKKGGKEGSYKEVSRTCIMVDEKKEKGCRKFSEASQLFNVTGAEPSFSDGTTMETEGDVCVCEGDDCNGSAGLSISLTLITLLTIMHKILI